MWSCKRPYTHCVTSGFRRGLSEICALRGVPTFRHNIFGPVLDVQADCSSRCTPEKGIDCQFYRRRNGPQFRSGWVRKISSPPGFDPRTDQPVGSRYTDYATRPTEDSKLENHLFRQCAFTKRILKYSSCLEAACSVRNLGAAMRWDKGYDY